MNQWTVTLHPQAEPELIALPADMQARFVHIAELLEEFGPQRVGLPHIRPLESKLWEMRMQGRDGIARAVYAAVQGRRLVVLALKAQGQCRATVEALAAIKNPPVVFAKQANIAHGPQQVNNGVVQVQQEHDCRPAHEKQQRAANELLGMDDGERLDSRAQGPASLANPRMATMEAIHRPKVSRGTRKGSAKQP